MICPPAFTPFQIGCDQDLGKLFQIFICTVQIGQEHKIFEKVYGFVMSNKLLSYICHTSNYWICLHTSVYMCSCIRGDPLDHESGIHIQIHFFICRCMCFFFGKFDPIFVELYQIQWNTLFCLPFFNLSRILLCFIDNPRLPPS